MIKAKRLAMVKSLIREPYAWPGGYPQYLITSDGGALSHQACKDNWREIVSSVLTRHTDSGWYPVCVDVNWEDNDLYCEHTGERIESAYGESESADMES
jgi:hypothetical protein